MTYDRQALRRQLRIDEGSVSYVYQDHLGYWTIGVGRLVDRRRGGKLSDEEIDFLLDNDIKEKEMELDSRLPWWRELDEVRQRVILNMAFNLGVGGLLGFTNTLKAIRDHDWGRAAAGMLDSKWARQVGRRAARLAYAMRNGRDETD